MSADKLIVRGAREHNLKNVTVEIPRDRLVVITGVSGSGKSSLAFDTIYAEGQRRYVESLSTYARQFLGQMAKPDCDGIDGLSPAIAIDQKGAAHNPRSTVGTVTEVYDFLRLLYARIGHPHCTHCGREVERQTVQQIVDGILRLPHGARLLVLAPLVSARRGEHQKTLDEVRRGGFSRVRIDGEVRQIDEDLEIDPEAEHTIEVVVDRLIVRQSDGESGGTDRARVTDSVETALKLGRGIVRAAVVGGQGVEPAEHIFSEQFACAYCGISLGEIEPRSFSFNSPQGACPACVGLGTALEIDPDLVVPDRSLSISEGAIVSWTSLAERDPYYGKLLDAVCRRAGISLDTPFRDLTLEQRQLLLYGQGAGKASVSPRPEGRGPVARAEAPPDGRSRSNVRTAALPGGDSRRNRADDRASEPLFEGAIGNLRRRYREAATERQRWDVEAYMAPRACALCRGLRLKPESLGVTIPGDEVALPPLPTSPPRGEGEEDERAAVGTPAPAERGQGIGVSGAEEPGYALAVPNSRLLPRGRGGGGDGIAPLSIVEVTALSIGEASDWFDGLAARLTERERLIARDIVREIAARLRFLKDVGLDYLTLDRQAATLSGGEAQRIRLATQIGSALVGVLYILDEPSIGLHQRDNRRLIETLTRLRDLGNTVLVVEHDEETIRAADFVVDIGPGAGERGGEVVALGPLPAIVAAPESITGAFLRGDRSIPVPERRRDGSGRWLVVKDARANNLKHVDVRIPLGRFVAVTGVSGSGKSTLVTDILYRKVAQVLNGARERPADHETILGLDQLDKVIEVDQSPIGRTPRSNPATYTGIFGPIRDLFASVPEAKARGYGAGRFSFNIKGGRCEACQGEGTTRIEMQFLPDVYVPCDVCHGQRYNREALEVRYKGKNIAEVLGLTVDDALDFFSAVPAIRSRLETLVDVGLGYVRLGQPATTLSGGEAQRVKLAAELARRATGRTLYILDEPTTGLHFADVERLLQILARLADAGNSVVVIEHNLDVVKSADWVIDLGPEGGDAGGFVVADGTPEQVARVGSSHTGRYLREVLK